MKRRHWILIALLFLIAIVALLTRWSRWPPGASPHTEAEEHEELWDPGTQASTTRPDRNLYRILMDIDLKRVGAVRHPITGARYLIKREALLRATGEPTRTTHTDHGWIFEYDVDDPTVPWRGTVSVDFDENDTLKMIGWSGNSTGQ